MDRTTGGPEPSPVRQRPPSPAEQSSGDEDLWFEVHGRDATLVGTGDGIVHRRTSPGGEVTVHEWSYADIRSFHIVGGGDAGSIVIEPAHGPLVPVAIDPDRTEEAYQAATVLGLLVARAQRTSLAGARRR
ncbi:MAG TPA: hypothetical protein VGK63_03700 [Candidatus Limnocylindrales bacterium]